MIHIKNLLTNNKNIKTKGVSFGKVELLEKFEEKNHRKFQNNRKTKYFSTYRSANTPFDTIDRGLRRNRRAFE